MAGMDEAVSADEIEILLRGCAGFWELKAQVERRGDGSVRMVTGSVAAIVSRGGTQQWLVTLEETDSSRKERLCYGSVLPMLRGLRAMLAPELPPARLIVAPSPGAGP